MAQNRLDKSAAAQAVAEIRRRRAERLDAARARAAARTADKPKLSAAKAGAVLELRHTREGGRGITYERKAVLCGKKGCNKLHGPYWYAFWTAGGKVRSVYIGKTFRKVEEKCPERLKNHG
jgi:hypothetical protein